MRAIKIYLMVILAVSIISIVAIAQTTHTADDDKGSSTINGLKDKITVEREAIIADSRELQEAEKTHDKARIEEVKKHVSQDIEQRKTRIRALYREMNHPKEVTADSGHKKKSKLNLH